MPYAERSVLVIDPVAKQIVGAAKMTVPNDGATWAGGVVVPDGRIFAGRPPAACRRLAALLEGRRPL